MVSPKERCIRGESIILSVSVNIDELTFSDILNSGNRSFDSLERKDKTVETQQLRDFYRGKTVLVTGHTGFKGSWLTQTLIRFGANVVGIGLAPNTPCDIFVLGGLESEIDHHEFDIRDFSRVDGVIARACPEVVFHLAAQPLVRKSYEDPLATISTNVIGTAHVLEAVRRTPSVRAAVIVTTDKVYENQEWVYGYRECDPLGGYDPYSGSKAAADIVAHAYLRSYFHPERFRKVHDTLIAIARAGNVIGGGDWSVDRLVPDIMRSVLYGNGIVALRNPEAVRPWEHVLEPVSAYLMLGKLLAEGNTYASGAWNFGPEPTSWKSVGDVTRHFIELLGAGQVCVLPDSKKHEAHLLTLDVTKARRILNWRTQWDMAQTLSATADWYAAVAENPSAARSLTERHIASYFKEE